MLKCWRKAIGNVETEYDETGEWKESHPHTTWMATLNKTKMLRELKDLINGWIMKLIRSNAEDWRREKVLVSSKIPQPLRE